jgi:hypothetical protein
VVALLRKYPLERVAFHGCAVGLVSAKTHEPIWRPWTVCLNCHELIELFRSRTCMRDRRRAHCQWQE